MSTKYLNLYGNSHNDKDFDFFYKIINHIVHRKRKKEKYLIIKPLYLTRYYKNIINTFRKNNVNVKVLFCVRSKREAISSYIDLKYAKKYTTEEILCYIEVISKSIYESTQDINHFKEVNNNVLILKFNEWKQNPQIRLVEIFKFLNLENTNKYIMKKSKHTVVTGC